MTVHSFLLQELGKQRSTFRVKPGFSSAAHLATSALFIAVPADTRLRATHEWSGVWDKEAALHWAASESHGDRAACRREEARSWPASATRAPAAPPSASRPTRSGTRHRSRTLHCPLDQKQWPSRKRERPRLPPPPGSRKSRLRSKSCCCSLFGSMPSLRAVTLMAKVHSFILEVSETKNPPEGTNSGHILLTTKGLSPSRLRPSSYRWSYKWNPK
nr:serine/arginine repetitive matrix protein 1-like [Pongo abelii]